MRLNINLIEDIQYDRIRSHDISTRGTGNPGPAPTIHGRGLQRIPPGVVHTTHVVGPTTHASTRKYFLPSLPCEIRDTLNPTEKVLHQAPQQRIASPPTPTIANIMLRREHTANSANHAGTRRAWCKRPRGLGEKVQV